MISFLNLKPVYQQLKVEIDAAIQRVIESGWYLLGPEVDAFEGEFAAYHNTNYAVSVANGTDAIKLALWAGGVGSGDEVITVAHTAMPTVTAIEAVGATPVLVDIDPDTYTIDPSAIEVAISPRTQAIIPVHLYGQPADMVPIMDTANQHQLLVIEDCAQAHGARYRDQLVGTFGQIAAFSFYPTKPMGAYGDGGAIITNNEQYNERLRRLRFYGQKTRYIHIERGTNSRLDEMQAAILRVKLQHLDEHNQIRQALAQTYSEMLQEQGMHLPIVRPMAEHVFHLYVIRHHQRDALSKKLKEQGIGTLIHYPIPIHLQESHSDLGYFVGSLPETERIAAEILSLPLYVGLTTDDIEQISTAVKVSLA